MFRVARNSRESGTTQVGLIEAVERAVRVALPSTWPVEAYLPRMAGDRPDAQFVITAPDGEIAVLLVEYKAVVAPGGVAGMAGQLTDYVDNVAASHGHRVGGVMLASPFVSPMTRARLDELGVGWFDLVGNLRLRLDRPAVFLDRAGADRSEVGKPAGRLRQTPRGAAPGAGA